MKLHSFFLSAFLIVNFAGCTVARIYATSGNDIAMTDSSPAGGESFKIEQRYMFDYTGAVDVQELLRERFGSGHKFENVSVKIKVDVPDALINLVTFGIAQSKTFEISGDKVK